MLNPIRLINKLLGRNKQISDLPFNPKEGASCSSIGHGKSEFDYYYVVVVDNQTNNFSGYTHIVPKASGFLKLRFLKSNKLNPNCAIISWRKLTVEEYTNLTEELN